MDGWEVTRVDEWDAGTGELTFSDDGRTVEVSWSPEDDGTTDLERVASAQVGGATAFVGRYQLGAKVAGAVVCGWIDRRQGRRRDGARRLPRLGAAEGMDAEGDYPEVVWQYADALNGRDRFPAARSG